MGKMALNRQFQDTQLWTTASARTASQKDLMLAWRIGIQAEN